VFRRAQRFAINILTEDQIDLAQRFAGRSPDKFEGVATVAGLGDVPLIDGALAVLECVRESIFPGGDHVLFVGRVERMASRPLRPLAFGQGGYLVTQSHNGSAMV
jgi:flavin reductase (DIM6/NTAB) family NADH-FMN oxidoreductase RutF